MAVGRVYLVGAGPGDPDLLTVKALRLIEAAETVVYDRLVGERILGLVPRHAERIFVGKAPRRHTLSQEEINALLVRLGLAGRRVLRLKGGDPYVFGRGSEEALAVAAHGIPFEIVPGVTAACGCGAYAGIPLTHRGLATGVRFVTGHCREDAELSLNWASLADPDTTLVFYMALLNLAEIRSRLVAAGLPADTPAAVVSRGTSADQIACLGTLGDLPERVAALAPPAPCLTIIGRVVSLAPQLAWAPEPAAGFSRAVRHG
ncbi:uroporphyrinogen-III C-methyltransferase [Azospirillum sp. YIM B02556]|uniref:uroporphyrinogen-III C-methyltransferase n=1 Tax=Azospirillum endophyticum TaxID=2800326 RepID=A0ABS1FAY4_9PROT|nr:uroporphyrinogen-III C-methyltransferase [Azospirillum endophyticum]MBK1840392.1 uroporphyrinogen-III C-methyltransferase [Azospirillum endophyticum]